MRKNQAADFRQDHAGWPGKTPCWMDIQFITAAGEKSRVLHKFCG